MNLAAYISERTAGGRRLLAPYLCAGFPDSSATLGLLEALVDAGADLIELGVPFSDPLADGPVLQAASQRALKAGMTLDATLDVAEAFHQRRPGFPLVLMSYVNPLLAFGAERLAERTRVAGLAALLVPDLPPEAWALLQRPGLPPMAPFAAINTADDRLRTQARPDSPFLYAVSVLGVTGVRDGFDPETVAFLGRAKALTGLRVLAGFGVSRPEQAQTLAQVCDGVIIGSALARVLEAAHPGDLPGAAKAFLAPFRTALDQVEASCS